MELKYEEYSKLFINMFKYVSIADYVWLPLRFDGEQVYIVLYVEWRFESQCTFSTFDYYEVIDAHKATIIATFNGDIDTSPAITLNQYGHGHAIYLGVPADEAIMDKLYDYVFDLAGLKTVLMTPQGVVGRIIDDCSRIYINTTNHLITFDEKFENINTINSHILNTITL